MSYPLPKMSTMISNATQAAKVVSRDALRHGKFKADPELKKSRLSFCQACEYYRPQDERCSHDRCGCFVKLKTWMNASKCPDGKW
jgi:hypothetical protein